MDIAKLVKEEDENGINHMVYERFTRDEWESQFKKDFLTMKTKGEVEFYYIEEYPFRKTRYSGKNKIREPHFIEKINDKTADVGPILIFFDVYKFFKLRTHFKFRPIMYGTCKFYGDDVELEEEAEAPEGNHIAFVGNTISTVHHRHIRNCLDPIRNQLGRERYKIYKKFPDEVDPDEISEQFEDLEDILEVPRFMKSDVWEVYKSKSPMQDADNKLKDRMIEIEDLVAGINESEDKEELEEQIESLEDTVRDFVPLAAKAAKEADDDLTIAQASADFTVNMEGAAETFLELIEDIRKELDRGRSLKTIIRKFE